MAVKIENVIASKARKIRKTIVAGGDQLVQAEWRTNNDDRVQRQLRSPTCPVRLNTSGQMNTEQDKSVNRYDARIELEEKRNRSQSPLYQWFEVIWFGTEESLFIDAQLGHRDLGICQTEKSRSRNDHRRMKLVKSIEWYRTTARLSAFLWHGG